MKYLTPHEVNTLELTANHIRQSIIEMLVEAGSGHTAGPLGMADIFSALYFDILSFLVALYNITYKKIYIIKQYGVGSTLYAIVDPSGSQTIDGQLYTYVGSCNSSIMIQSDGSTNWSILSKFNDTGCL